jgi:hypothetical protein
VWTTSLATLSITEDVETIGQTTVEDPLLLQTIVTDDWGETDSFGLGGGCKAGPWQDRVVGRTKAIVGPVRTRFSKLKKK